MNTGNMTMVYGAVAILSVLLLIGYLLSYVLIMVTMIWYAAKNSGYLPSNTPLCSLLRYC